jgi:large subunit ribosomal protein L17
MTTTLAKAKTIQPIVERLVTLAREDTDHHRRLAWAQLGDQRAVAKLFDVIAPRFVGQPGGYTRIYRIGRRRGDGAPLALIEFVA